MEQNHVRDRFLASLDYDCQAVGSAGPNATNARANREIRMTRKGLPAADFRG